MSQPIIREDRRERQRRQVRERIESAAVELFATQGYRDTTMDQIAERSDTARRTLFYHFPRKRDILERWWTQRRAHLLSLLESEALRNAPAREQLHRQFATLARFNTDDPALARVQISARTTEMQELNEPLPVIEAVHVSVELGQARGEFHRQVSPQVVAEVLTICYFDTVQRWVATDPPAFDLTETLKVKLDLVLDGLAST